VTRLPDLPTPALILDRGVMDRNIARMAARAAELGVPLRPHGKTPKCGEIGRRLMAAGAIGLTVSTLREAEGYFDAGVADLFYAVALAPAKVARAAALRARGAQLTCLVDHPEAVAAIAAEAVGADAEIPLVVEIDVDGYRSGLPDRGGALEAMARDIAARPGVRFSGVMSYGGASYGCDPAAAAGLAERHRAALVGARDRLAALGLGCPVVSFGSSPAVLHARSMDGVTELRCGIHVFQDLFQAAIGACAVGDVAVSVLTTVIGVRPDLGRIVVDAGGLAMSKDLSTQRTPHDAGYGLVCDIDGRLIEGLFMPATSQELGIIEARGVALPYERLTIGTKLRILPNHADMTAAAYDRYAVVDGGRDVVADWERFNGW